MSEKTNAVCSVCGSAYQLCLTCEAAQSFTGWRRIADTTNCYKIFITLQQYTNQYISKEEAGMRLASLDLTRRNDFVPYIRQMIASIYNE